MKAEKLNKKFDRWILPFFIVVVTLFSLASIYNLTLGLDDLIRIDGEVRNVRIEEERDNRGRINYMFYVYLTEGSRLWMTIFSNLIATQYNKLSNLEIW